MHRFATTGAQLTLADYLELPVKAREDVRLYREAVAEFEADELVRRREAAAKERAEA